jgi:hypothetical protein
VEAVEKMKKNNMKVLSHSYFYRFHELYGGFQPLPHRFRTVSEESLVNYNRFHNRFHKTFGFLHNDGLPLRTCLHTLDQIEYLALRL